MTLDSVNTVGAILKLFSPKENLTNLFVVIVVYSYYLATEKQDCPISL